MKKNTMFKIGSFIVITLMLQSCFTAAIVAGAAAGGATIAGDSRTFKTQTNDFSLWRDVARAIAKDKELKSNTRITGTAYNSNILLIGQAEKKELADRARNIALGVSGVKNVYNKISNEKPVGILNVANDSAITALVKAKLLADRNLKAASIKVITENQIVYLLGTVSKKEEERVVELAKELDGVKKIVSAFEYK